MSLLSIILDSLLVTAISLFLLVAAIAVFMGYVINQASAAFGTGLVVGEYKASAAQADSMLDDPPPAGADIPIPSSIRADFPGSSHGILHLGPRGEPRTSRRGLADPIPCRFCSWARALISRRVE